MPYFNDFRQGNFDAGIDFMCEFMDEPDLYLVKYLSSDKSPINYARYKDPTIDELYERQSRMLDIKDRLPLLRQIEKRVFGEQDYQFPVLWWQSIVPHHEPAQGLEDRPEPLRQSGFARRVAGAIARTEEWSRMEDRGWRMATRYGATRSSLDPRSSISSSTR